MIIIEGVDNSGKTTLAKKLSSYFDAPLVHSPGPKPTPEAMVYWAERTFSIPGKMFYDRHPCISEVVYGLTLRHKNAFDTESGKRVTKLFYEAKPLIIYCHPPIEIIKRNMGKQMGGVKENLDELLAAYDKFMSYLKIRGFLIVDYDYTHSEECLIKLLEVVISAYYGKGGF